MIFQNSMNKLLSCVILFCTLFISSIAYAQPHRIIHRDRLGDSIILKDINDDVRMRKVKPKPRLNSISFGPAIYTDGLGLMINYSRSFGTAEFGSGNEEKFYNSHFVQLEVSERYHRKEYRETSYTDILNSILFQSTNFMYGKTSNVYNLRLNYGQRRLFGGKGEPNSPLIQYYGSVGFNALLTKPYYINLFGGNTIKYSEETEREFINRDAIEGKAGFTKGLNELEFVGAATIRVGLYIDIAQNPKRVSAFDVGFGLDYAFSEISQIVNMPSQQIFFNAYVSYQWGKKF